MPPTISYNFGDIVLVPFPFTDQSTTKRRPAVIISSSSYHRERADLIMAVTSQARPTGAVGEVEVKDWQSAGLIKPSIIKPVITTIEQTLVIRRLGQIKKETQERLRNAISMIVG